MIGNRKLRDMSPPKRIETGRLLMRIYRGADAKLLLPVLEEQYEYFVRYEPLGYYALLIHPSVGSDKLVSLRNHLSDWRKYWNEQFSYQFGAFLRDTGQFVAEVTLTELENHLPEYSLSYFGDANLIGQGYLTEVVQAATGFAFEHLLAYRVSLWCDDTNTRNILAAERSGYIQEVHLREDTFHPDRILTGTLQYGMLRGDYDAWRKRDEDVL